MRLSLSVLFLLLTLLALAQPSLSSLLSSSRTTHGRSSSAAHAVASNPYNRRRSLNSKHQGYGSAAAYSDVHADNDSDDPLKVVVIPNPLKDGVWRMPFSAGADPSEATEFFCGMYVKGFCYRSRDPRCPRLKLLCQFLKRAAAPPRSVIRQQVRRASQQAGSHRSQTIQRMVARSRALRFQARCVVQWIVCVKKSMEKAGPNSPAARGRQAKAVRACKVARLSCLRQARARTLASEGSQPNSKLRRTPATSGRLQSKRKGAPSTQPRSRASHEGEDEGDDEEDEEEQEEEDGEAEEDDDALDPELFM